MRCGELASVCPPSCTKHDREVQEVNFTEGSFAECHALLHATLGCVERPYRHVLDGQNDGKSFWATRTNYAFDAIRWLIKHMLVQENG